MNFGKWRTANTAEHLDSGDPERNERTPAFLDASADDYLDAKMKFGSQHDTSSATIEPSHMQEQLNFFVFCLQSAGIIRREPGEHTHKAFVELWNIKDAAIGKFNRHIKANTYLMVSGDFDNNMARDRYLVLSNQVNTSKNLVPGRVGSGIFTSDISWEEPISL